MRAAILLGSIVIGSQLVPPSMAQDLGQMGEQARERIIGALQNLTGGTQISNQTGNQSGDLGQLGEKAQIMLPGRVELYHSRPTVSFKMILHCYRS